MLLFADLPIEHVPHAAQSPHQRLHALLDERPRFLVGRLRRHAVQLQLNRQVDPLLVHEVLQAFRHEPPQPKRRGRRRCAGGSAGGGGGLSASGPRGGGGGGEREAVRRQEGVRFKPRGVGAKLRNGRVEEHGEAVRGRVPARQQLLGRVRGDEVEEGLPAQRGAAQANRQAVLFYRRGHLMKTWTSSQVYK